MKLTIYWVERKFPGRLGIILRPRGNDWLDDELRSWKEEGVDIAISLLTHEEETELGLAQEKAISKKAGIEFHSFPIPDRGTPKPNNGFIKLAEKILQKLHQGKSAVIHCRQSVGRSSLLASVILIEDGLTGEEAIKAVHKARKVEVPETKEQREWILSVADAYSHKR